MAILWIDIETLPSEQKPNPADIQAPANYKDPAKIAAYQEESVDKVWREQALNSAQGRLLCIGYAVGNAPAVCRGIWDMSSYAVLSELNDVAQEIASAQDGVHWGGFNLKSFDLDWIWHRAVKYDLAALMDFISRDRYPKNVLDVRDLWTGGDNRGKGKLKDIAKFLGIETLDDMDGSQVLDTYLAGDYAKIAEYCRRDVEMTREIAWRMGKGSPPVNRRPRSIDPFAPAAEAPHPTQPQ